MRVHRVIVTSTHCGFQEKLIIKLFASSTPPPHQLNGFKYLFLIKLLHSLARPWNIIEKYRKHKRYDKRIKIFAGERVQGTTN